ncbi:MAG: prolyl oligopeptidase family serine peptidase [Planctomycetota bacterium]|nr:prolyl oligopeptidase family serine peptidase [Planctomycetota bacterium]
MKNFGGWLMLGAALVPFLGACQAGPKEKETTMAATTRNAQDMTPGIRFVSIAVGGETSKYAIYVPRDYDASKPWPLIVFLNGAGECGTDGQRQLTQGLMPAILNKPQEWPFVVLFPQKPDQKSKWEDHAPMVLAMIDNALRTFTIDASRVYLTGLSQGGHGTWAIGSMHPERFAALAPVCGYGRPESIAPGLSGMPIWAFHGTMDKVVLPEQSEKLVEAARAAGANASLTLYPGVDHNSWDKAYRDENLGRWFLSHVKPAR